jgi:hypothetical protein
MTKEDIAVEEEKARAAAQEQAEKDEKAAADKKAEEEASALEAKMKALEEEKNKAIEEAANWKIAALKNKAKNGSDDDEVETEEERVARLVAENLTKSKVAQIDSEKAKLLEQALKENKELKLAQLHGKKEPVAAQGSHNEGQSVRSTLVTKEQEAAFKARGWTDKDIERYKKNLLRYQP